MNRRISALAHIWTVLICPRHPKTAGSHQTAACWPLHGNFTPPRFAPSCPHLLRRLTAYTVSTLDFMAGQEYRPIACYRRTEDNPIFIAGGFSLTVRETDKQAKNVDLASVCPVRRHGATANVAYLYHNNNGNVLDEWAFNFQEHPAHRPKTGNRRGV